MKCILGYFFKLKIILMTLILNHSRTFRMRNSCIGISEHIFGVKHALAKVEYDNFLYEQRY